MWNGAPIADGSRFDAIVVGAGAAGGVAAARLCEAGLNVAIFEAGSAGTPQVNPVTRSLTALARFLDKVGAERRLPPKVARLGERVFRRLGRVRQPVQSGLFAWAMAPDILVDDRDCPYETEPGTRFSWFRSRRPGGRMLVPGHGRQYYRLAGMTAQDRSGSGIDWPFGLNDLDDWYGWVEDRLQLKGGAHQPSGARGSRLAETLQPTGSEQTFMDIIRARWPEARPVLGTFAPPLPWLDKAAATGRLTCQADAVVRRVLKNPGGAAEGVEWIDSRTGSVRRAHAPIVFLCASAIESTRLLMLSRMPSAGSGTGTGSPALGRYLMDHAVMSGHGFCARLDDVLPEQSEPGRCIHIPPHETLGGSIGVQIHIHPRPGGGARVDIVSFAEMLPDEGNRVTLSPSRRDRHGMLVPVIRFQHSDRQHEMAQRQAAIIRDLARDLGLSGLVVNNELSPGGTSVHECGTARMGTDPATSVLDQNNECWDVPGLFVTDAASFPRQHVHNPTLTIMALTARAAALAAARHDESTERPADAAWAAGDQPARASFRAIRAMSGVG
ncbi:GMC oxidoreductase [Paracoccus rhizosphaerae]|uniref:GMC oxidoreductase n=1 Tax=Paracoccus rhizosphaerae TaxID=1133347 RepID=A0ABV6CIV5_9RHOB|nr:GMC oxidoreductase [Paracoccus rhizosphaerae]